MTTITIWKFQCSSASRKFLNRTRRAATARRRCCFSALQRAENSSIVWNVQPKRDDAVFQCSSASRKFLNRAARCPRHADRRVSVLFSEPKIPQSRIAYVCTHRRNVSVLFSEPKIPQCCTAASPPSAACVSVLFSEPKIPQLKAVETGDVEGLRFSALQRAENSSIQNGCAIQTAVALPFQCSSASRKFLNLDAKYRYLAQIARFSALQRAENSSIAAWRSSGASGGRCFSALQRAENSSIRRSCYAGDQYRAFQCSSASRKFLNLDAGAAAAHSVMRFSALQRAENSSIAIRAAVAAKRRRFSALQRAENSSIPSRALGVGARCGFQCSSASRKFLNRLFRRG